MVTVQRSGLLVAVDIAVIIVVGSFLYLKEESAYLL